MARKSGNRRRKTRTRSAITRSIASRNLFLGYRHNQKRASLNRARSLKEKRVRRKTRRFLEALRSRRLRRRRQLTPKPSQLVFRVVTYPESKKRQICRNRYKRKQVLFALNKTGQSGQKRPKRRNPDIICRRK
jgi:hypothetical protein